MNVYINMYIIRWSYMMMRYHKETVMLRSTTGPYGRTCDRNRIWENDDSLHRGCCGWWLAREEWLGCWHDASPMFDIPGSTPVWAPYLLFSDFQNIKTYIYYVFKSIHTIKEHWWSLISSWPDEVQRKFSTAQRF